MSLVSKRIDARVDHEVLAELAQEWRLEFSIVVGMRGLREPLQQHTRRAECRHGTRVVCARLAKYILICLLYTSDAADEATIV